MHAGSLMRKINQQFSTSFVAILLEEMLLFDINVLVFAINIAFFYRPNVNTKQYKLLHNADLILSCWNTLISNALTTHFCKN